MRGPWRLEEAETGAYLDIEVAESVRRGYVRRLRRLQDDLDGQMRIAGGAFVTVRDTDPWDVVLRGLLHAQVIET